MGNELRSMLLEAVATPPDDVVDLAVVTRRGAQLRRRERRARVGSVALAACVAAVSAVLLTDLALGPESGGPGPASGEAERTTLADAAPAVAGRDYEVVADAADVPGEGPVVVAGTTVDGQALLWAPTEAPSGHDVALGLLDLATGERTWLPEDGEVPTVPLELGEDRLVFLVEVPRVGPRVSVYDRAAGTWSTATWEGVRGGFTTAAMGPEGRLWFDRDGRLVSGSLTDPADVRDEGIAATTFDIHGETLVSLGTGAREGTITVTDLDDRLSASFEAPLASPCGAPTLDLGEELLALGWSCGYAGELADPEPTDSRALVVTTSGQQVADVSGLPGNLRLDARVVGDDVLLTSQSPLTTYDPAVCDFPFDGLSSRYLRAWSDRTDELVRETDAADGWERCQASHQAYRELVLPHLDEARVPDDGYGYYLVDGESGRLLRLTEETPARPGWGLSEDGRGVLGTRVIDVG